MRLEPQFWIEPRTFLFGWTVQSSRWLVLHVGPFCVGIGRLG